MMDSETRKLIDFLLEIEKLKLIKRKVAVSDGRHETTPEHVWHMCMYAMMFEKKFSLKIDLLKTIKMILVHDLVEVYADDTSFWDEKARLDKEEREEAAAVKLFSMLPSGMKNELSELWNEYKEMKTNEAKVSKSLDALQVFGQHLSNGGLTMKEIGITKDMMEKKVKPLIKDGFVLGVFYEFFKEAKERKLFSDG